MILSGPSMSEMAIFRQLRDLRVVLGPTLYSNESGPRLLGDSLPIPLLISLTSPGWRAAQFRSSANTPPSVRNDLKACATQMWPGAKRRFAVVGRLQHVFGGQVAAALWTQGKKNPSEHQNLDFRLTLWTVSRPSGSRAAYRL